MKRKVLSIFAAIAVAVGLAGCQSQTATMDSEVTTEFVITTKSSATIPSENSNEPRFVTEFEITDWTMEELIDNIYLCGQKITLPSKASELDADLKLSSYYDELFNETVSIITYNDKEVSITYCNGDCNSNSDIMITNIQYGINKPMPEFDIMGITESSTPDEVKSILGEPNYIQDDGNSFRYVFSDRKQLMLSFNDDYTGIDFYHISYEE